MNGMMDKNDNWSSVSWQVDRTIDYLIVYLQVNKWMVSIEIWLTNQFKIIQCLTIQLLSKVKQIRMNFWGEIE